jgi:hypothetical protein
MLLSTLLLCTCAALEPALREGPAGGLPSRPRFAASPEVSRLQGMLAEGGRYVLGKTELVIRDRRFNMDCSGAVLAIYYYAGIDLSRDFGRYSGGGVMRLYKTLEARRLIYETRLPMTGDIIFWDNTYDRNGDGQWNDPLTHVGMVMSTAADGTVQYVHLNYHRGIVLESMNLLNPNARRLAGGGAVKIVNSPMRMKEAGRPHPPRWLSSQLYRCFGRGYLF